MAEFTFEDYRVDKHQYQEDGERLLMEKKHAFLFYEPGKGKTYPAIAALQQVAPNGRVLILSTADSITNMWNVEIVPQNILPKNTILMSFNAAIQDATKAMLLKVKWDVIIVDESHKVKSHNSQISKLVYQLTKNVRYAWGLTGTPRGNCDIDIFCQFHNLNVDEWGDVAYTRFVNTCCDVKKSYGAHGPYQQVTGINSRYRAGWERNVAMHSQRICYEDGDMPPLNIVPHELPFEKSNEYKRAEDGILIVNDDATTMAKLAAITKMHQAANGYLYWTNDQGKRETYRFGKSNYKLVWLREHLLEKEPVVIVYRHEADLQDLQDMYPYATEDIDAFKKGQSQVLLLQCSRCESFNLQNTGCKRMIFYTMDYSYIKFKQMLHRVWRQGQENETTIDILLYKGSIEEEIWKAVEGKKKLADLFMSVKTDLL